MDAAFWIKAAQLITSLSLLVLLHEFGHYLPAKLFGMKVEKFYLFFNPKFSLWKKKIGETVYGIGWIPLGGYVKISGMIDESMDKEQMAKEPEPWEFRSKPAWQRLIVMLGGIIVNVILGYLIFIMVSLVWGKEYLPNENVPQGFAADSVLIEQGFHNGDMVVAVGDNEIDDYKQVSELIVFDGERQLTVLHQDGTTGTIDLPEDFDCQLVSSGIGGLLGPRIAPVIGSFPEEGQSNARDAGLEPGDQILTVDSVPLQYFDEIKPVLHANKDEDVQIVVLRDGDTVSKTVHVNKQGLIGFAPQAMIDPEGEFEFAQVNYGFGDGVANGVHMCNRTLYKMVKQFGLFTCEGAGAQVGGLGTMGSLFTPTWDWHSFWLITGLLSIMLAILNLLPIPALDGGHVMFLLYEMITGRKPNEKFMEYMQYAGMILLLSLILYANINDIVKFFG